VVALGAALYVLASWIVTWGSHLPFGSVTFTNLPGPVYVGGLHPWVKAAVWIIAIAVWAALSMALLRSGPSGRDVETT